MDGLQVRVQARSVRRRGTADRAAAVRDDLADVILGRWAAWLEQQRPVSSAIGYRSRTTEAMMIEYGAIGSGIFGPKVPTWFCGTLESRVHTTFFTLRSHERAAIALKYLWQYLGEGEDRKRVTDALRASQWAAITGKTERSYYRALKRGKKQVLEIVFANHLQ